MDRFWDALQNSTILQASISTILVLTICYLFIAGRPIPELLASLTTLVFGFWFGSKSQQQSARINAAAAEIVKSQRMGGRNG